jgi:hypothetical protein
VQRTPYLPRLRAAIHAAASSRSACHIGAAVAHRATAASAYASARSGSVPSSAWAWPYSAAA